MAAALPFYLGQLQISTSQPHSQIFCAPWSTITNRTGCSRLGSAGSSSRCSRPLHLCSMAIPKPHVHCCPQPCSQPGRGTCTGESRLSCDIYPTGISPSVTSSDAPQDQCSAAFPGFPVGLQGVLSFGLPTQRVTAAPPRAALHLPCTRDAVAVHKNALMGQIFLL